MGFLRPCHSACQPYEEPDQPNHLHSDSSNNPSISSQPSLPSVPSLNSRQISTTHHHCISTLKGHSSHVFSLTLAGKHLYTGTSNSQIRLWSRTPSHQDENPTHNIVSSCKSAVKSLLVLGDKVFSAHQDHKIRVWKIDSDAPYQTYKCISILPTLNDRVARLFFSKNYVEVRRHQKCTWVHHVDAISALVLSNDGSLIYSASWDRTFKVWRTSDFKCLESVWNAHDDAINAIVSSSDGFIYTGSADRKIKVWRKKEADKKHNLVDVLEKHKSAVNALALSSDGSVLYSGACDRSIIVWEKIVGGAGGGHMAVAGALRGHTKAILCLAAVADLVCSGSADKTVRIWRRGISYSCLAVLEGHRGAVKCLTAAVDSCNADNSNNRSPIGTPYLVYSGSLDSDVKVWQLWVPYI